MCPNICLLRKFLFFLMFERTLQLELQTKEEGTSGNPKDEVEIIGPLIDGPMIENVENARNETGFNLTGEEIKRFKIWPGGEIPYFIDTYSFDPTFVSRIRDFLEEINRLTGLRFTELVQPPDSSKERWVMFLNRRGVLPCVDYDTKSFTVRGVQRVVIGYDCVDDKRLAIAPAILALVGVPAQHNAPNRDEHITVNVENILPEKRNFFTILKNDEWLFHDISYDYSSAGHYGYHAYSNNGSATIVPKNSQVVIGETKGMSEIDILKVRMLYNYIIATKKKKSKAPDCERLFKTVDKIKKIRIRNRKKPEKYLGLHKDNKVIKISKMEDFNSESN